MTNSSVQRVLLATGMQSSGSTLVSWCFLQHGKLDGVLDGDTDLLPLVPDGIQSEILWYKTTISSFTLADLIGVVEDENYQVIPFLIVRDVRAVWLSLAKKHYGLNGITAEDPPLRLRFRRFLASWEYARQHKIPVLKFEDFVVAPETCLKTACQSLGLDWDQAMMTWPKPADAIANMRHGNATFRASDKQGLTAALQHNEVKAVTGTMHKQDLDWLEATFTTYNEALGYPEHISGITTKAGRAIPSWQVSRRKKWRLKQKFFRYLLSKLKLSKYSPRPE